MHQKSESNEFNQKQFDRRIFIFILGLAVLLLFWGVWWGWPGSFDQHDPTKRAIRMLWDRSLDPGIRYWGAFGYQEVLLLSVVPITVLKKIVALDPGLAEALMYLMTRVIWAIKAVGIVLLTYVMSKELFQDRRSAMLSMLLVALAPGFIAWSHIPQVDLVHAFWYTVAAALTAMGWRRSRLGLLWVAAIAAGLAAGVKYVGGIVVLAPMLASFMLLSPAKAVIRSLALGALAVTVFFVTTPLVTGDVITWLTGYTADLWANNSRDAFAPLALWTMPGTLWDLLGPGSAILGLIGGALIFLKAGSRGGGRAWMLLLFCILPYYLIFVGQHVATVRYMLPITATLAVAIGFLITRGLRLPALGKVLKIGVIAGLAVNLLLVLSLEVGFASETRVALVDWMNRNIKADARVETLLNHRPYFTGETRFEEISRPHFQAESHQMYRDMVNDKDSGIRKLHAVASSVAGVEDEILLTWVLKERKWLEGLAQRFDVTEQGPVRRGSDYVVLNVNTANHYVIDWPGADPLSPNEKDFYLSLLEQTGPFRLKASFDPLVPEWLRYPTELWINISPPIRVYEVVPQRLDAVVAGSDPN